MTNVGQIVFNLPVYLKQSVVHLPEFNEYITLAHTRLRESGDLDFFKVTSGLKLFTRKMMICMKVWINYVTCTIIGNMFRK